MATLETARRETSLPHGSGDRWTVDAFYQALDAGAFEHPERLELIHGRIIEKMPQSALHANVVEYLTDCLRAALSPRFRVRDEKPIHIAFDDEPVPDITVVEGRIQDIHQPHPQPDEVALLVEVAISSEESDLGEKALLYAQAGIGDYWVVLPVREMLGLPEEMS